MLAPASLSAPVWVAAFFPTSPHCKLPHLLSPPNRLSPHHRPSCDKPPAAACFVFVFFFFNKELISLRSEAKAEEERSLTAAHFSQWPRLSLSVQLKPVQLGCLDGTSPGNYCASAAPRRSAQTLCLLIPRPEKSCMHFMHVHVCRHQHARKHTHTQMRIHTVILHLPNTVPYTCARVFQVAMTCLNRF